MIVSTWLFAVGRLPVLLGPLWERPVNQGGLLSSDLTRAAGAAWSSSWLTVHRVDGGAVRGPTDKPAALLRIFRCVSQYSAQGLQQECHRWLTGTSSA